MDEVSTTRRTCRYQHGDLTKVESFEGNPVSFAIVYAHSNEGQQQPKFVGGLDWYLCPVCGYTELVDATPGDTLSRK